jgi:hypothetical protein
MADRMAPALSDEQGTAVRAPIAEQPVDARQVASFLGLSKTDWVYAHAEVLGGFRLGRPGPNRKPRWRFLLSEIPQRLRDLEAELAPEDRPPSRNGGRRSTRRATERGTTPRGVRLLDFKGS